MNQVVSIEQYEWNCPLCGHHSTGCDREVIELARDSHLTRQHPEFRRYHEDIVAVEQVR